jgi:hypothetical protein
MRKATKKSGLMRMGEASGAPQRMGFLEAAGIATGIGVAISGVSIAADVLRDKLDIGPKSPEIDVTLTRKNGNIVAQLRNATTSEKDEKELKKLKAAVKDAKRDLEDAEGAKEKREAKKALKEAEEELEEFQAKLRGDEDEDEEDEEEPTGTEG